MKINKKIDERTLIKRQLKALGLRSPKQFKADERLSSLKKKLERFKNKNKGRYKNGRNTKRATNKHWK